MCYAQRWESQSGSSGYTPACALEWQKPICQKPLIKCSQCQHRQLLPLTDQVIIEQLNGEKTIGVYPLSQEGTSSFLAVDFDGNQWQQDSLAFTKTCNKLNVPYSIERSRSGNGAHVWIFLYFRNNGNNSKKIRGVPFNENEGAKWWFSLSLF